MNSRIKLQMHLFIFALIVLVQAVFSINSVKGAQPPENSKDHVRDSLPNDSRPIAVAPSFVPSLLFRECTLWSRINSQVAKTQVSFAATDSTMIKKDLELIQQGQNYIYRHSLGHDFLAEITVQTQAKKFAIRLDIYELKNKDNSSTSQLIASTNSSSEVIIGNPREDLYFLESELRLSGLEIQVRCSARLE